MTRSKVIQQQSLLIQQMKKKSWIMRVKSEVAKWKATNQAHCLVLQPVLIYCGKKLRESLICYYWCTTFALIQTSIQINKDVLRKHPQKNQQTTAGTLPILTAAVARMLIAEGAANCHVVCVISECQSPMCTCHWWGSLWIPLMAFRVLIAGFCMEWLMNN